jgi:TonB family protein
MKKIAFLLITLFLAGSFHARADVTLSIKLNFFGPASTGKAGGNVATSFSLKSLVQRNLKVEFTAESLLAELKKTFNVPDVTLLASADLAWHSGGPASVMQIVQIDGRDYALLLTPLPRPGAVNFKVGVVEENDMQKIKNVLLDTEIVLPEGEVAMLGFRDLQEHAYFIAFYVQGQGPDWEFARDAIRIAGKSKPKIIKKVLPVYPVEALKQRIEGVVILEAVIDKLGRVRDTRPVASPDPLLTAVAEQAVKQWVYEPYLLKSVPKEVLFTVTVTFALNPEKDVIKSPMGPLTRLEDSQKPKIIKKVSPAYPEAALLHKVEGVVVLEVTIDEQGKVKEARIVSYSPPILNQAALDAVRQWEYEPFVNDGKAKKVTFTVTVTFSMDQERYEGIPPK